MIIQVKVKGSASSGNYNHTGIPGSVGGSAPSIIQDLQNSLGITTTVYFVDSIGKDIFGNTITGKYNPEENLIQIVRSAFTGQDLTAIGFSRKTTAGMGLDAVLAHEMFHAYDGGYEGIYSKSKAVKKLFLKEKTFMFDGDTSRAVSRYSMTSEAEFLAENFAVYKLNPRWLQTNSPEVFKYFQGMLSSKVKSLSVQGKSEYLVKLEYRWA